MRRINGNRSGPKYFKQNKGDTQNMYWLRTRYVEWTKNQGIELMKDDIDFIERTLSKIPKRLHKSIMRDYAIEWLKGIGEDDKASQNQNLGRRRASVWLREKCIG